MADTDVSEDPILKHINGKTVWGIHYEAEQLANLTIIDYTKELLSRNSHRGIHLTKRQVKKFFERSVCSTFAEGDVRRQIMHQQANCPVFWDFWEDLCDPDIRQKRIASQEPGQFRVLERDKTTANGFRTIMSDGYDDILVLHVGYFNLQNFLYVDVVQLIHDHNPNLSIPKDKMQRIWTSIIYEMNHYESENLKAKKLEEMYSQETESYWQSLNLHLPGIPSYGASLVNEVFYCETCRQPVPTSGRSLPPPPGIEGTVPNLPPVNVNKTQDTTTCGPLRPEPEIRPATPLPPCSQTAQPFPMFTISLPRPAMSPMSLESRAEFNDQSIPPGPSFSQTAHPLQKFTIALPRDTTRPWYSKPRPSFHQIPQPPRVLSRQSWPYPAPPEQAHPPVPTETTTTRSSRPPSYRRLYIRPSSQTPFILRTRAGDLHVPGGA